MITCIAYRNIVTNLPMKFCVHFHSKLEAVLKPPRTSIMRGKQKSLNLCNTLIYQYFISLKSLSMHLEIQRIGF